MGGYPTLSFIPTLATMILGLFAGELGFRAEIAQRRWLTTGLMLPAMAFFSAHRTPIVKRIWTPSWTLFSGGICFLLLSAFSWIIDVCIGAAGPFPSS